MHRKKQKTEWNVKESKRNDECNQMNKNGMHACDKDKKYLTQNGNELRMKLIQNNSNNNNVWNRKR